MAKSSTPWHRLEIDPNDLPEIGERVIIDVGHMFVGEGYLKVDGKWYRYDDLGALDEWMSVPVVAWRKMPEPSAKPNIANNYDRQ